MMKKLMLVMLLVVLTQGCSKGNDIMTPNEEIRTKCIDGVEYYLFTERYGYKGYGFMSPKYNRDGSVALCD